MAAITGRTDDIPRQYQKWIVDWLHSSGRWSSPRFHLAAQLRYIRQADGKHASAEYRNYLLWLGVYPTQRNQLASTI